MTTRATCCPDFAEARSGIHSIISDDHGTIRFNENGMIVKFCPWCATQWDFGMKPLPPMRPEEHGAS